jgi:hypothetical protein
MGWTLPGRAGGRASERRRAESCLGLTDCPYLGDRSVAERSGSGEASPSAGCPSPLTSVAARSGSGVAGYGDLVAGQTF